MIKEILFKVDKISKEVVSGSDSKVVWRLQRYGLKRA